MLITSLLNLVLGYSKEADDLSQASKQLQAAIDSGCRLEMDAALKACKLAIDPKEKTVA